MLYSKIFKLCTTDVKLVLLAERTKTEGAEGGDKITTNALVSWIYIYLYLQS